MMAAVAPDALLFDLDGTLTDNFVGIARSIAYALERLDTPIPDDATLRRCVGPPLRESFRWLLDTDDAELVEQAIGLYRERFADVGWRENVVYDGVYDAFAALASGAARMYVCTSKPEVYARRIVTLFGFSEHLDGVYGVDLAGRFDDKVALLAHLVAAENIDPARAILIGDRASDMRCSADQAIERRGRAERIDALGAIRHAERQADAAIQRLLPKRPDIALPVKIVGHGRGHDTRPCAGEAELGIQVLDQHEPLGTAERQRLQQHRSHDAEDHGVAAETDDEGRQHSDSEAALAGPAPQCKSRITKHV